jgi:hypothetical protein
MRDGISIELAEDWLGMGLFVFFKFLLPLELRLLLDGGPARSSTAFGEL